MFACKKCAPGRIAPSAGTGFCRLCPGETFAAAAGLLRCQPCSAGTTTNHQHGARACTKLVTTRAPTPVPRPVGPTTAPPTRSSIAGQDCPAGKWERSNREMHSLFCGSCPPGKFQPQRKRTFCRDCAPGRYTNNYAATECQRCPAGQFLAKGAAHKFECTICQPGRYSAAMGMISCMACSAQTRHLYETCATPAPTPVVRGTPVPTPASAWFKQQKKWVVRASSASSSAAHPAASMLDDEISTFWLVRRASPAHHQWVVFDLGSDAHLSRVKLFKNSLGGIHHAQLQSAATVSGPWRRVAQLRTARHQQHQELVAKFAPTTSRFWRLDISELWPGDASVKLCELNFFGYLVATPAYMRGHGAHGLAKLAKLGDVEASAMDQTASTWSVSSSGPAAYVVLAGAAVLAALKLSARFASRDDGYSQVVAVGDGGAEEQPLGGGGTPGDDIQLDALAEDGGEGAAPEGAAALEGAASPGGSNPFASYRA